MAKKLTTFETSLGFYDLAIAAPSMKARFSACGADSNLSNQGVAKESDDPDVVAATMAKPGVVLRRPVGSQGPSGSMPIYRLTWPMRAEAEVKKGQCKAEEAAAASNGRQGCPRGRVGVREGGTPGRMPSARGKRQSGRRSATAVQWPRPERRSMKLGGA
jgi:hypothetical protein